VRAHPVFEGPRPVNTTNLVRKLTPAAWREAIKEGQVLVLPLVKNVSKEHQPGWISYREHLVDSPEVEIICGGLSERNPDGAALWRQGHLLHFAFDLSPTEMNETGQALLLNSIAYIARFTEDRPIARTPSGWGSEDDMPRARRWAKDLFAARKPKTDDLRFYLSPVTISVVTNLDSASYRKWFEENSAFLTCDKKGRLLVDAAARELGLHFDQPQFFPKSIERLKDPASAAKARELLSRYAPDGPPSGSAEEWEQWWQANRPYLFFSERGSYRWYIDPLAKRRGLPSDQLRGPARASLGL
jgi:hypothetical protein